ncbi:MAG: hypothetical protein RIT28_1824, partial [Pseudomonadota bacterium]
VSQPQRGAEVEGPVVKLNSLDPSQGGEVVLHAQLDGGPRFLHLSLGAEDYRAALAAHAEERVVRCVGELGRERGVWVLRGARWER